MAVAPMTGTQKAAAVLMQFSQAAAAAVMSKLSDAEATQLEVARRQTRALKQHLGLRA